MQHNCLGRGCKRRGGTTEGRPSGRRRGAYRERHLEPQRQGFYRCISEGLCLPCCFPGSSPAKTQPERPIHGPETLWHNIEYTSHFPDIMGLRLASRPPPLGSFRSPDPPPHFGGLPTPRPLRWGSASSWGLWWTPLPSNEIDGWAARWGDFHSLHQRGEETQMDST